MKLILSPRKEVWKFLNIISLAIIWEKKKNQRQLQRPIRNVHFVINTYLFKVNGQKYDMFWLEVSVKTLYFN